MLNDLRHAARVLLKSPGFTTVAVATLALGIGANTALFSVVNAVLLRPLPYRDAGRIVQLWESNRASRSVLVSRLNFLDWRNQSRSFDLMALYSGEPVTATGGDLPQRTNATAVSRGFFEIFPAHAVLGRTFLPDDLQPSASMPAVIGYGLWQRAFASNPNVTGRTVHISGIECHVVGVAPPGFQFPDNTEFWVPFEAFPDDGSETRSAHNYWAVGRLKSGVTVATAQAELDAIARRIERQYPESNKGQGVTVLTLQQQLVGDVQPALLILLGAVGFVLLIACANVANLLLARSTARSREMAVRAALGAGRARLISQVLTESLLLSAIGGSVGLLLAVWAMPLVALLIPASVPRTGEIGMDATVLWFALGISALTGVLFGLLPAIRLSQTDLNESLKEAAGRTATGRTRRAGNALIISELALSVVLLIAAGLLIQSFMRIMRVDPGFRSEHVLVAHLSLPVLSLNEPPQPSRILNYYRQILERTQSVPGVSAAGTSTRLPLGDELNVTGDFDIEGRTAATLGSAQDAGYRVVSPGYFRAMGIPLLRGRSFNEQDAPSAPQTALINETMARRFWPGEDPVGRRIKFAGMEPQPQWMTVVGIVGDVLDSTLTGRPEPQVFAPFMQHLNGRLSDPNLVVRGVGDPKLLVPAIRDSIRAIDKNVPVEFSTMDALLADSVSQQRFQMRLLALFAALALALAAVGIYGVVSYSVSRRTHEIGIRVALGAERADVLRLVLGEGARLAVIGIAIGISGAVSLNRVLASQLYGIGAMDLGTYAAVSVVLLLVAFAAAYIPARRATSVDPLIALRYE
jgi:putative ABC transport system permease protein